MVCVINCRRNASVRVCVYVCVDWVVVVGGAGGDGEGGGFREEGLGGSSSVTGICSVVRAPYLSASLNQFHAEVS